LVVGLTYVLAAGRERTIPLKPGKELTINESKDGGGNPAVPHSPGPPLSNVKLQIALDKDPATYDLNPPETLKITWTISYSGSGAPIQVPKRQISDRELKTRLVFRDPDGRRVAYTGPVRTPPPLHTVVDATGKMRAVELSRRFLPQDSVSTEIDVRTLYELDKAGTWEVHAELPIRVYRADSLVTVPSVLAGGQKREDLTDADAKGAVGGRLISNTVRFKLQ